MWASIEPPAHFSFVHSYTLTLAFILDIRRYFSQTRRHMCPDGIRRTVHAAFGKIQTIDSAAGLVLAAEIDRWSRSTGRKARSYDQSWVKGVRSYFIEAGLFELLRIDPESVVEIADAEPERRTLKFFSATSVKGEGAVVLRTKLEALCGRAIGPRAVVYGAIAESIANVIHAYPNGYITWPRQRSARWWTCGSWTPASKTVNVQMFDQGAGIPKTLIKRPHFADVLSMARILDSERSDARLIEAALTYGRTSTGIDGRGKGLSEMAKWIDTQGHGFLRITSGKGEIEYRAGKQISRRSLPAAFCGTLVEWEFRFDD